MTYLYSTVMFITSSLFAVLLQAACLSLSFFYPFFAIVVYVTLLLIYGALNTRYIAVYFGILLGQLVFLFLLKTSIDSLQSATLVIIYFASSLLTMMGYFISRKIAKRFQKTT